MAPVNLWDGGWKVHRQGAAAQDRGQQTTTRTHIRRTTGPMKTAGASFSLSNAVKTIGHKILNTGTGCSPWTEELWKSQALNMDSAVIAYVSFLFALPHRNTAPCYRPIPFTSDCNEIGRDHWPFDLSTCQSHSRYLWLTTYKTINNTMNIITHNGSYNRYICTLLFLYII